MDKGTTHVALDDSKRTVVGRDLAARGDGARAAGVAEGAACDPAAVSVVGARGTRPGVLRSGSPGPESAPRGCPLCLWKEGDLALIHVGLQTWFPLQLPVYVNGTNGWSERCRMLSHVLSDRRIFLTLCTGSSRRGRDLSAGR
jgi:hypothetical protein